MFWLSRLAERRMQAARLTGDMQGLADPDARHKAMADRAALERRQAIPEEARRKVLAP